MGNTEPERNSPYAISVRASPLGIITAERELLFLLKQFNCYPPNRVRPLVINDPDGLMRPTREGKKLQRMLKRLKEARPALEDWLGKEFISSLDWDSEGGLLGTFQRICDLAGHPTHIGPYSGEYPTVLSLRLDPIGMKRHDHLWREVVQDQRDKTGRRLSQTLRQIHFKYREQAKRDGLASGQGRKSGGTTWLS